MHWLQMNWALVLGWVLYVLSDAMPYLPGKAQNVVGFILNIGKAIASKKLPPAPPADGAK